MQRSSVISLIIIVIVVAGGGLWLWHRHNKSSNSTPASTSSTTSNQSTSPSSSSSGSTQTTNQVTIANFAFGPSSISVKKGTTVTWTNKDSVAHTVTSDSGSELSSSSISPSASFSHTFNTAGTFSYHCSIHTEMTGTVTVTE